MPNIENEMKMTHRQYPGVRPTVPSGGIACGNPVATNASTGLNPRGGTGGSDCEPTKAYYDEKLLVGYRWYDEHRVDPAFPFGFGLSFTTFNYSSLKATPTKVSFVVTNTGLVTGTEVTQLYLAFPPSAGEPPQQLKGFQKVTLGPGKSAQVTINLQPRSFSIWSVDKHEWAVVSGEFGVKVGGSSRDQPLHSTIHIQ
jgi:beta-glucosidase